jgi:3-hydroxybutyryl-CoA dehydrogenase
VTAARDNDAATTLVVVGSGEAAAGIVAAAERAGVAVTAIESALGEDLDAARGADLVAVIVSATDSITEIAARCPAPERVGGLHPVDLGGPTDVVEVVAAEQTSPDAHAALVALLERLGKTAVPVKDRPGLLVARLLFPYLNQALQAYDDGIATRRDIDVAVELGLGYPRGPLEVMDRIGAARHLEITSALFEQLGQPAFAPPPLLSRQVAAGADPGHDDEQEDDE